MPERGVGSLASDDDVTISHANRRRYSSSSENAAGKVLAVRNMKSRDEKLGRQFLRRERRRTLGRAFWELPLQASRVADADSPASNIYCATFFSRHNISIPDQQYRSLRLCH